MWTCKECETINQDCDEFCSCCGAERNSVPEPVWFCENCGAENKETNTNCYNCGRFRASSGTKKTPDPLTEPPEEADIPEVIEKKKPEVPAKKMKTKDRLIVILVVIIVLALSFLIGFKDEIKQSKYGSSERKAEIITATSALHKTPTKTPTPNIKETSEAVVQNILQNIDITYEIWIWNSSTGNGRKIGSYTKGKAYSTGDLKENDFYGIVARIKNKSNKDITIDFSFRINGKNCYWTSETIPANSSRGFIDDKYQGEGKHDWQFFINDDYGYIHYDYEVSSGSFEVLSELEIISRQIQQEINGSAVKFDLTSTAPPAKMSATSTPNSSSERTLYVGDIITFGRYEQDNNQSNGAEPIEWIVLYVNKGQALLISNYGLETRAYHTYSNVTWENSLMRSWLNKEFLNKAFTSEEQKFLVKKSHDSTNSKGHSVGNSVSDKVFLLDLTEFKKYTNEIKAYSNSTACKLTAYAAKSTVKHLEQIFSGSSWWLRSQGDFPYLVDVVSSNGGVEQLNGTHEDIAVRPAIWVRFE